MSRNAIRYRPSIRERRNPPPPIHVDPRDDWTEQDEMERNHEIDMAYLDEMCSIESTWGSPWSDDRDDFGPADEIDTYYDDFDSTFD